VDEVDDDELYEDIDFDAVEDDEAALFDDDM